METFAYLLLLIALMADAESVVVLDIPKTSTYSGSTPIFTCGWQTFSGQLSGYNKELYTKCGSTDCLLQLEAGRCWVAFGILASFCGAAYLFGAVKDYIAGEFDKTKPIDYWKGCGLCPTLVFNRLGLYLITVCELLMLIGYGSAQKCSSYTFWTSAITSHTTGISSIKYAGGVSMGFVALGFIIHVFVIMIIFYTSYLFDGQLPNVSTMKKPVVQIESQVNNNQQPTYKKPPQPAPPINDIPQSQASTINSSANNDINNNNTSETVSNNSDQVVSIEPKKEIPKTSAPVPPSKIKPSVPPPVPI